jgi:stringent starvation protein B
MEAASAKPYLLRALYEWCADQGHTPYIVVYVDEHTNVPREFAQEDEIVLDISSEATNRLQISNDWVEFDARFSGKARKICIPIANVMAIYAAENGQGMAFPVDKTTNQELNNALVEQPSELQEDLGSRKSSKKKSDAASHLKIVK